MREIKFRAKRIDNGKWVYGHYFKTPLTNENSGISHSKGWFFLSDGKVRHCISNENGAVFVIDPETLGEWTGRYSVDKKEIYEGDWIKAKFSTGVIYEGEVVFRNGAFNLKEEKPLPKGLSYCTFSFLEDFEVTGNIYGNSELLQ